MLANHQHVFFIIKNVTVTQYYSHFHHILCSLLALTLNSI